MLGFFLSTQDLIRIDPNSISVEEAATANANVPSELGFVPAQFLIIRFTVTDPQNGAPRLNPFFSGYLQYQPYQSLDSIIPEPSDVDVESRWIDSWATRGQICIKADEDASNTLRALNTAMMVSDNFARVLPNKVWFYPIKLTPEFIFDQLSEDSSLVLDESGDTQFVPHGHHTFLPKKISSFFKRRLDLWIRQSHIVDSSTAVQMPSVDMQDDGRVTLVISMALEQKPQDYEDIFDSYQGGTEMRRDDLRHKANGFIPPRNILEIFKDDMQFADLGNTLVKEVCNIGTSPIHYTPIQFTRTSSNVANCSIFFPSQQATILDDAGNILWEESIPAHGFIFLPSTILQNHTVINVDITPLQPEVEMRFLKGSPDCWKQMGDVLPVEFDLSVESEPYVVLRNRMVKELLHEDFHKRTNKDGQIRYNRVRSARGSRVRVSTCTYMSLRRTIHAWLSNRILGGRYNFEYPKISPTTKALLRDVLPDDLVNTLSWHGPSTRFKGTRDQQVAAFNRRSAVLRNIAELLFPDPAPSFEQGAAADSPYPQGRVFYYLWQTEGNKIRDPSLAKFFSDEHVGRGAPGALVYLGLADYTLDPTPSAGQSYSDEAFLDSVVSEILDNKSTGSLLQFWQLPQAFENVKSRNPPDGGYGHSPILFNYVTLTEAQRQAFLNEFPTPINPTLMQVIDQSGRAPVVHEQGSGRLNWLGISDTAEQIWICAEWKE